jgi:hypothetical protein
MSDQATPPPTASISPEFVNAVKKLEHMRKTSYAPLRSGERLRQEWRTSRRLSPKYKRW